MQLQRSFVAWRLYTYRQKSTRIEIAQMFIAKPLIHPGDWMHRYVTSCHINSHPTPRTPGDPSPCLSQQLQPFRNRSPASRPCSAPPPVVGPRGAAHPFQPNLTTRGLSSWTNAGLLLTRCEQPRTFAITSWSGGWNSGLKCFMQRHLCTEIFDDT